MYDRQQSPLLLECAWEACNQVGGIYTVLKTKAPAMVSRWDHSYFLIGPYNRTQAQIEFEATPPDALVAPVLASLNADRERVHYGRWLIPGEPQVFLVEHDVTPAELNRLKKELWESERISTITPDPLVDQVLAFGLVVRNLITALSDSSKRNIIAHFHEWMAGVAIPHFRDHSAVRTVFTTHATLIGRYVAGDNRPLYKELDKIQPELEAKHYGIESRHHIERAAAQRAHAFTTVSDVTGQEAKFFLGRKPDALLPNGLNVQRFTALHEFQNLHRVYKEKIHEFVMAHFFPSYTFDLDRTLYFLVSGRYEYRNKGMDIFIAALERLNARLMQEPDPPTIVAFVITSRPTKQLNVEALRGSLLLHDLRTLCREVQEQMGERLLSSALHKSVPSYDELLPRDTAARLKRAFLSFSRSGLPSVSLYELSDESDPVINRLSAARLNNAKEHPVKIIYHPEFITATSPPIHLDYEPFVRGCHLGVFPSYYEPWGYTPLECIALGLPTVTTDLSGFGTYVQENIPASEENGILVLKRSMKSDGEVTIDLANHLYWFSHRTRRERIELRNRAERLAEQFDWSSLARHYDAVHSSFFRV